MSTPEQIAAQAQALARVRADKVERDKANERLRASILAALATGAARKDVALAAGVSPQRVSQIATQGQ